MNMWKKQNRISFFKNPLELLLISSVLNNCQLIYDLSHPVAGA